MSRHEDICQPFNDVLDDLIITTPTEDEAVLRPYAISNGATYEPISYCPFCGRSLARRNDMWEQFVAWRAADQKEGISHDELAHDDHGRNG